MAYFATWLAAWTVVVVIAVVAWNSLRGLRLRWVRVVARSAALTVCLVPNPSLAPFGLPMPYAYFLLQQAILYATPLDKYAVHGRVIESKSGQPIAQALIVTMWGYNMDRSFLCEHVQQTVSDVDGMFTVAPAHDIPLLQRKRLPEMVARTFAFKADFRTAEDNVTDRSLRESGHEAKVVRPVRMTKDTAARKEILSYLGALSDKVQCPGSGSARSRLTTFQTELYRYAKGVASTPEERATVRRLCRNAAHAVVPVDGYPSRDEIDAAVGSYLDRNFPECVEH